jgi:excisionase family DNA binding protein
MTRPALSLADLAAHPERVDELAPADARGLLVALASLQPLLIARAMAGSDAEAAPTPARLLTVPEAAERLSIPQSYQYELIRQGRVPAQRIGPKYVRLHPATIADIQQRGLTAGLSDAYSTSRDGNGARGAAQAAQADAGGLRRTARRPPEYASKIREGRDRDPRARRAVGADLGASS